MVRLTWLGVPGDAAAWSSLGFIAGDGIVRVGDVVHGLDTDGMAWGFDDLHADAAPLGVPTRRADLPEGAPPPHPNRITHVDHVVYTVPSLDDAVDALTSVLGAEPRRRFRPRGPEGPEMAFYRVGEALIEVVAGRVNTPRLSGIAYMCPDLDACAAAVRAAGGEVGDPKAAVQGGRIATMRSTPGGLPIAVMQPPERR